jgi:hypothetical protein
LLIKQRPVEAAVLNRFQQMWGFDILGSCEVGDGAGDFEDAVIARASC